MKKHTARDIAYAAIFCATALAVHTVEAQIPPLIPVPGVKLGLANAVTMFAMFTLGVVPSAFAHAGRILLGSFFGGGLSALLFSASGGTCGFIVSYVAYRRLGRELSFVAGAFGGVTHNAAQLAVAAVITRTPELAAYLPALLLSGIVAGAVTGFLAGKIRVSR